MSAYPDSAIRRAIACAVLIGFSTFVLAQEAPIVHPGPPGEASRILSADEAIEIANTSYSPDDVTFMQDMIPHHNQAMQMAVLVADRTNRPELVDVAGRINVSQQDEIQFMQQWLRSRGERVPNPTAHDAMHTDHRMAGMATRRQMEELAASNGTDFDRMFLQLMITHHEGAVTMVEELLEQPGSAYDPVLFEFTTNVTNDQASEIERMHAVLISLSDDPRAGLSAGFMDAGAAIRNLALVGSLEKPPGFYDPENPAGLPPEDPTENPEALEEEERDENDERFPLLSFANTDMAFFDDIMVTGSYHGFNIYQLQDNGVPKQISSVVCPGGQGDVSVVGDLLIMSVEEERGRVDCGLDGINEDISGDRFMGIRIFNISNLTHPVQVGQVQTCRGSHTHSVVSIPEDANGSIIVYNSGNSPVREEDELEGYIGEIAGDERTALFRIDVIEIPVERPHESRIVHSPAVFADEETGSLAGLWRGGEHSDVKGETQETEVTDQCHDITVFPEKRIAAGACSGNGILFDISDPLNPMRIDAITDKGFAYWHSATFNNDGTKVLFTDEWGGGSMPRCRAFDPLTWGADAFYEIVDDKLEFQSYYKLPAPQVEQENCVAHNGSIIPVPGRDIFVQAWYQGGVSLVDFTDTASPIEIAYFDRGPIHAEHLIPGGYWSTYWYNGKIYGTEIARGIDVFSLIPSEYLSEAEIAAAGFAEYNGLFNPQTQTRVTWPAEPVVAMAYLDQLQRSESVSASVATELSAALDESAAKLADGGGDSDLAARLVTLAGSVEVADGDANTIKRFAALGETLHGIAARLR